MGTNVNSKQYVNSSVPKILVVGQLGMHEKNIMIPLVNALKEIGEVNRIGGNTEFFHMDVGEYVMDTCYAVPPTLENVDVVFFADFWNFILPMYEYIRRRGNPSCKFVTLVHGSINLDHDVATVYRANREYEKYLIATYDKMIVPYKELTFLLGNHKNVAVAPFPSNEQVSRKRPKLIYNKRVIYPHRISADKGFEDFTAFVYMANSYNSGISFYVTGDRPNGLTLPNTTFTGRMCQEELRHLCGKGGYVWSSAKSEIFAYSILDCISYGLTPLLNYHSAYREISDEFKYKSYKHALKLVESKSEFTDFDWKNLVTKIHGGDKKIAKIFTEV